MQQLINRTEIEESIREVYTKVCDSFACLDFDGVLSHFDDSNEIVKISNGKLFRTKDDLKDYWNESILQGSDLKITIENLVVNVLNDKYVWTTADEYISLDGKIKKAVVSNIFKLTSAGWKILLDHTTYVIS